MPVAARFHWLILTAAALACSTALIAAAPAGEGPEFPRALASYGSSSGDVGLFDVLRTRAAAEPFNVVATAFFALAIIHTFLAARFRHWAHVVEERHAARRPTRRPLVDSDGDGEVEEVSFPGQMLHFLGEIEAVFGTWALALLVAIAATKGGDTAIHYVGEQVNFTEPMFVVVVMALASTRPILRFAEQCLRAVASLGKGSTAAWWLSILIIAPLLGSFITEPAAMTIGAILLGRQFYARRPSPKFCYATLGLLFVNVSVGGTLTHFAAPPVLMVAGPWGWDMWHMLTHFGWKAVIGILVATGIYYLIFRKEFEALDRAPSPVRAQGVNDEPVPAWVTIVQLLFLAGVVYFSHYPPLFIGIFLFFLAFSEATAHHQSRLDLRPPLLVGFFLAGLVIHGGLQGWWIEPVLTRLTEVPLFLGATALTALNDNAAITYLATLVPDFTDQLKYAVVAGAVAGGGLTVIANAPNPAGQTILERYFAEGVSPLKLLLGALLPTAVMSVCFLLL